MSKKNIIIIIAALSVISAITLAFLCGPKNNEPSVPSIIDQASTTKNNQLIGGERDEHGCLVPGGYSWCEEKQKCLRVWEEACSFEGELKEYLQKNISSLSLEKEVLGGKFYITDLRILSSSTAEVSYEDGHMALQAKFNYTYKPGQPSVSNFSILPEPAPTKKETAAKPSVLSFQPMSCEDEPWQEWYKNGPVRFIKAPTDEELIKTYYGTEHSINIISAARQDSGKMTCEACSVCPKSYYFTAEVSTQDAAKLEALGWKK